MHIHVLSSSECQCYPRNPDENNRTYRYLNTHTQNEGKVFHAVKYGNKNLFTPNSLTISQQNLSQKNLKYSTPIYTISIISSSL